MFVAMLTIACSLVGKAAEGDTYKLVTDASELKSGDIVVIASKDKAVAMGAPNDKKEKYQPVTGIKITDDVLAYKEGFTELLLEGEAGKWYFKYGNGYICKKHNKHRFIFRYKQEKISKYKHLKWQCKYRF